MLNPVYVGKLFSNVSGGWEVFQGGLGSIAGGLGSIADNTKYLGTTCLYSRKKKFHKYSCPFRTLTLNPIPNS